MDRPLVVLQSTPQPTVMTNPYTILLHDHLNDLGDVDARFFSWRTAFLSRYDVYHSHWPDILVAGRTPLRRLVRQLRVLAFLARLRLTGTALVRTVHNIGVPEGITRSEGWMLQLIERVTDLRIVLNPHTPTPDDVPRVLIPHGHYREWFAAYVRPERVPGRLAYVGRVRPYKGVDTLIRSFRDLTDSRLTLHVSGYVSEPSLGEYLRSLAQGDDRVTLRFGMLTDDDLVSEVGEADLVVLPYTHMHNSGAALLALSMDRPVLAPRTKVNEALAAEVGPGWVLMYDGALTSQTLVEALESLHTSERTSEPDLSARDWPSAAREHRDAYLRVHASTGALGRRHRAHRVLRASIRAGLPQE